MLFKNHATLKRTNWWPIKLVVRDHSKTIFTSKLIYVSLIQITAVKAASTAKLKLHETQITIIKAGNAVALISKAKSDY